MEHRHAMIQRKICPVRVKVDHPSNAWQPRPVSLLLHCLMSSLYIIFLCSMGLPKLIGYTPLAILLIEYVLCGSNHGEFLVHIFQIYNPLATRVNSHLLIGMISRSPYSRSRTIQRIIQQNRSNTSKSLNIINNH